MTNPDFPAPMRINGRLFWRRSQIEKYKREIIASATGAPVEESTTLIEEFVPADVIAREFGFTRRTLGRRIVSRNSENTEAA